MYIVCVCVFTHMYVRMYMHVQGRSHLRTSSSIAFPFILETRVLSKARVHRLNFKDPLSSPLPSLLLGLQVCTTLPDILPRA